MKRAMIFCLLLFMLAISCRAFSAGSNPDGTATSMISEEEAATKARDAIEEVVGEHFVGAYWLTLRGDRVFAINYATNLKPASQPDAFADQFNRVAFIVATYFNQAETQSEASMVMAEDIDFPTADGNPPLYQVVIRKEHISAWVKGEATDAQFIESWYVIPLSVFPTPKKP